ncbi:hypothetical protein COO60DRAFT_538484 [Scenedesmus sp. NREL 46B-D3]|nr:hypothetical protein COO60DRAFT_538484 [Scenedesmus sp. NREL 46B-D3]
MTSCCLRRLAPLVASARRSLLHRMSCSWRGHRLRQQQRRRWSSSWRRWPTSRSRLLKQQHHSPRPVPLTRCAPGLQRTSPWRLASSIFLQRHSLRSLQQQLLQAPAAAQPAAAEPAAATKSAAAEAVGEILAPQEDAAADPADAEESAAAAAAAALAAETEAAALDEEVKPAAAAEAEPAAAAEVEPAATAAAAEAEPAAAAEVEPAATAAAAEAEPAAAAEVKPATAAVVEPAAAAEVEPAAAEAAPAAAAVVEPAVLECVEAAAEAPAESTEAAAVAEAVLPAAVSSETPVVEEINEVAAAALMEAVETAGEAEGAAGAAEAAALEVERPAAPATPDDSSFDSTSVMPGSKTPAEAAPAEAAAPAAAAQALPAGWGPSALSSSSSSTAGVAGSTAMGARPSSPLSSRGRAASSSPVGGASGSQPGSRPSSPGRNGRHVASAAAAASMDWVQDMQSNEKVAAAREAEQAAKQKAARLATAKQAATAAAAESQLLHNTISSSRSGSPTGSGSSSPSGMLQKQQAYAASVVQGQSMPAPPEVVPRAQQGYTRGSAGALSAAAAAAGLRPPAVASSAAASKTPGGSSRAGIGAAARAADASMDAAAADGAAASPDWAAGMQLMSALAGCAAVGTVLWSEFVLKETGCGLPPGPYGLLGAAEGISYLSVLGFAGAGAAARGASGGRQGLPGALKVPEVLAYGALAAGLFVLASQLREYGYIPPPLPGGECYPDAAVVALPGSDGLSQQLTAQLAALQGILHQLQSSAADGIDQLALQEQLAALQQQADTFSAYMAQQAGSVDASLRVGLVQLQDSLASATDAVSSFAGTQLQQLDIPGKLAFVLDVLKKQEQALVVELPRQFAELQRLAATSVGLLQDTASQAAHGLHLPELLASLDKSMGALHDVLEVRIQQLDVLLTQLHDSCAAAASQLAAAASAAQQAGAADAAAQLSSLQQLLSGAIASVQEQVWAGYQQLALADHLSESLLHIRAAAAAAAAATTAEVDKLQLQQQLAQLESVAEHSLSALSATPWTRSSSCS